MQNHSSPSSLRVIIFSMLCTALAACGSGSPAPSGGGGGGGTNNALESGVAIDGPLANADVTFFDAAGNQVGTTTTDAAGLLDIEVPDGTSYPITVRVSGGMDTVTGEAGMLELAGLVTEAGSGILLTPFSTLAIRHAECTGTDSLAAINALTNDDVDNLLGDIFAFGLHSEVRTQLLSALPADGAQTASVLLASEIFSEILRRMEDSFATTAEPLTADEILTALACDIDAGSVDGEGDGSSAGLIATFQLRAVEAGLEAASGQLKIGGDDATTALNNALSSTFSINDVSVDSVTTDDTTLSLFKDMVFAAIETGASSALIELFGVLNGLIAPVSSTDFASVLDTLSEDVDIDAIINNALQNDNFAKLLLGHFNLAQLLEDSEPPVISAFIADAVDILPGENIKLSWSANGTSVCNRDGLENTGWNGVGGSSGTVENVGPIEQNATFTLSCVNESGATVATVEVTVPPLVGLAIDGPVQAGGVTGTDAEGRQVVDTTTDNSGFIEISPDGNAVYPLTIKVTGGTDSVTGNAPSIELAGILSAPDADILLTPFSTLGVRHAECAAEHDGGDPIAARGAITNAGLNQLLGDDFSFGLNNTVRSSLLGTIPTDATQAASLLLASEMFVESLRRAATVLGMSADNVLTAIACDLDDGVLNGNEAESTARTAAIFRMISLEVGLEAGQGDLQVNNSSATTALNTALLNSFGHAAPDVSTLSMAAGQLAFLQQGVHDALQANPSSGLLDAFEAIIGLAAPQTPGNFATVVGPLGLDTQLRTFIDDANPPSGDFLAAVADDSIPGTPTIDSFTATPAITAVGGNSTLAWTTQNATICEQGGQVESIGWSGFGPAAGPSSVGPVTLNTDLTLTCAGPGGVTSTSVAEVSVPPTADISFSPAVVNLGDDITINYNGNNADTCSADLTRFGAVTNGQTIVGVDDVGDVSVTCNGRGGMAITIAPLPVKAARFSWLKPTATEDGSPLGAITKYRVYHGTTSESRTDFFEILDGTALDHVEGFPSGQRYFQITAFDGGLESDYSEEKFKEIP